LKRALERKNLKFEREGDTKPKPAKKKPVEKDDDVSFGIEFLKPSVPEQG
jgi:hypothetical protein